MLHDERHIELTEDDDALWRFIYRHSGLSKLKYITKLAPGIKMVQFKAGERINTKGIFYIILDGVICAETYNGNTGRKHTFPMLSGQMLPLQHIYCCTQSK